MLSVAQRVHTIRRTGADAGITLVELMVTMVLMTIVSGLALSWLIGENTTDTKTQNSSFATADARNVLQAWPALLQVADSPVSPGADTGRFTAISASSITFSANVANAPAAACANTNACSRSKSTSTVTLSLVKGALTQSIASPGAAQSSITLVRSGAALASACLFTTYDAFGNSLGCNSSTTPLGSVARVALAFTVTPAQNGTPQTFQTSTSIIGALAPIVSPAPAGI